MRAFSKLAPLGAVVIGAVIWLPVSAPADVRARPIRPSLSAPLNPFPGRPLAARAGGNVIVCEGSAQDPHKSTHVPGTINVVVTVTCTGQVADIGVRAALYRNRHRVAVSRARYFPDSRVGRNNAAVKCRSGKYTGGMTYTVLFPPGYVPASGSGKTFGNSRKISC